MVPAPYYPSYPAPDYGGFSLLEWTAWYSLFTTRSWAIWSHNRGRSRFTLQQWQEWYQDQGAWTPYGWACWACNVNPVSSSPASSSWE